MISFQDKIDFLKHHGWTEKSLMCFVKNGYEIVWDTSLYAEIYLENNKKRLEDVRVETLDDLEKLLRRLEKSNTLL